MPILITEGSQMQCSFGTTPSQIEVTSQSLKKINDTLIATEADKKSMVNIPTFGNCKRLWYRPICKPNPLK